MTEHARLRAFERYGVDVSPEDLERVGQEIAAGKATLVLESTMHTAIYDVVIDNTRCRAVFDARTKHVVTFLPGRAYGKRKSRP